MSAPEIPPMKRNWAAVAGAVLGIVLFVFVAIAFAGAVGVSLP